MFQDLHAYLKRFEHLTPPERLIKKDIQDVILIALGAKVKDHEIKVQGKTAFITTSPALKSEIVLHKGDILKALRDRYAGVPQITEIR